MRVTTDTNARVAVVVSLAAVALTLLVCVGEPSVPASVPTQYPLVCGESFHDGQTGQTTPMYTPCASTRPVTP